MSVFYQGRHVFITHEVFEAVSLSSRTYAIRDLADVHIVRIDPEGAGSSRVLGLSAVTAAFVVVPVVGRASWLLALVSVLVLMTSAWMNLGKRPPVRWKLVAHYAGTPETLFSTCDQIEFDQVCRGLQRSLERKCEMR